jgi:hypothetical protein
MKSFNYIFFFVVVFAINACKKEEAGFTADKTVAFVGDAIHFYDNGSSRKNCTFTYDFGDGANSANNNASIYYLNNNNGTNSSVIYSDRNPSHIYWQPGTYEVTQTIAVAGNLEKGKSRQLSYKLNITIEPINADFSISDTVATTSTVVHFVNTTPGSCPYLYTSGNFAWYFINTTNPGQSNNITDSYFGSAVRSNEAYVIFNSPGIWKVEYEIKNEYYYTSKTKTIIIN